MPGDDEFAGVGVDFRFAVTRGAVLMELRTGDRSVAVTLQPHEARELAAAIVTIAAQAEGVTVGQVVIVMEGEESGNGDSDSAGSGG